MILDSHLVETNTGRENYILVARCTFPTDQMGVQSRLYRHFFNNLFRISPRKEFFSLVALNNLHVDCINR